MNSQGYFILNDIHIDTSSCVTRQDFKNEYSFSSKLPLSNLHVFFVFFPCRELIESFLATLQEVHGDFTNSFRCLSVISLPGCPDFNATCDSLLQELVAQSSSAEELRKFYKPTMHPRYVKLSSSTWYSSDRTDKWVRHKTLSNTLN